MRGDLLNPARMGLVVAKFQISQQHHSLAMSTMHPPAEPKIPEKIQSQESPLSHEWTHAITTLMGHPLSSEPGKHIMKWIIYHRIYNYTMFALKWNPTQFELDIHLQM